jgi:hypothetical protein
LTTFDRLLNSSASPCSKKLWPSLYVTHPASMTASAGERIL